MTQIKIPLASPVWEYHMLKERIDAAVGKVLEEGKYILGPEVGLFEAEAASYLGAKHAVGMSSGTDALLAALMAAGVGAGKEVITTAFSFIATASVIARLGAHPVFVDIEERGFNMDPDLVLQAMTPRTAAIIVVHIFGQPARIEPVLFEARRRGIVVIEDCAQAFGATIGSRRVGTLGDIGCYSFFPAKPLGAAGDAGLVTTDDDERARTLRSLRVQGASGKNIHQIVGGNFRLDTLQAAILRAKLALFDRWIEMRRENAALYCRRLEPLHHAGEIVLPREREGTGCTWAQFSILAENRDALQEYLAGKGIGAEVYYPMPLPYQQCLRRSIRESGALFPRTESACRRVLSIPIHPSLSAEEIEEVARTIAEFYGKA